MTTALSSLALILTIIRFALFIRLHTVESPYSPVRHAVSDYAVGPTRRLATATTWLTSATWLALAGAAHGLRGWNYSGTATVLLLVLAAIFAILPAFPTTLEGQRLTTPLRSDGSRSPSAWRETFGGSSRPKAAFWPRRPTGSITRRSFPSSC